MSARNLYSFILPGVDKTTAVTNDEAGYTKLINYLSKYYEQLSELIVVFEPTDGYEHKLT